MHRSMRFIFIGLLCFFVANVQAECGGTFFKARKTTTNNALQHNLSLYWWYHTAHLPENDIWWTFQATPLLQQSNSAQRLAQFFLPCNKECISIREDGTGDVGSLWLNLMAPDDQQFDACLCLRPQRRVVGSLFNIRFSLSRWLCNWWLDTAFAVIKAEHALNMCVQNSNGDGIACDVSDVCQALYQPDWQFGKFSQKKMINRGVDDIQLKLGRNIFFSEGNHLSPYVVGTIATGQRSCPEYIFEPTVGSKTPSIGFGTIGEVSLCQWERTHLGFLMDFKYRYLFSVRETRSFDLCKNGDWSRYLQVVAHDAPSNSLPGINLFTREVRVTPRSTIDWLMALHFEHCQFNAEIGYDFWYRQKEKIELCGCMPKNFGIYDMVGDCALNPTSAHCAAICQSVSGSNVPASDPSFVALVDADVNLDSGATPRAISNTLYGALGYVGDVCRYPALIGVGAYYEFGTNCAILSNVAVWIKCALAF